MPDASLRDLRQSLLADPELRGDAFCQAYARAADDWLSSLADRASGGDPKHLALIAVGGYGRGGLCPYSDLDVVLVHDGRRQVAAVADAIWYPVWDQGVHLDHSVRRAKEVLEVAAGDLRVALGLLDGRMVWGDPSVAEPLLEAAVAAWRDGGGAKWLPVLAQQMEQRHHQQGDVAFLLEPDLKESHGGLRDVSVLRAMGVYAELLGDYVELASLKPAADLLTMVRVELHRHAGRALDRLLLQEQDQVADTLGYPDADQLMAAVSGAGRRIAWVSDDAWRRRALWLPADRRRTPGAPGTRRWWGKRAEGPDAPGGAIGPARLIEGSVEVAGGEVGFTPSAPVESDPAQGLVLAAVAAELDLPIARGALHRLGAVAPEPPDPWPAAVRQALVRVLAAGKPAIAALESLDQEGLLVRLLPEWQAVRNKPQRNAYHRFTVDRHLLETAANAATLVGQVDRPDLLLVGALLHDIGKGFPGDHTDVGMEVVGTVSRRMGFEEADQATLVDLVRLHLLLPDVATRRDLSDPGTIDTVARAVGDLRTLALLAALTEADSLATGPSAWGSWKAGLVTELVDRTRRRLVGDEPQEARHQLTDEHRDLMEAARRQSGPTVQLAPPMVAVAAPDRRGLLASVAGTLALHGLDVRSADAGSQAGVAVEQFTVEPGRGRWPDKVRLQQDLEAVLGGTLSLRQGLAAKAAAYAGERRNPSALPVEPGVWIDNEASATSTVVEIRAGDEIGLLHRLTQALFDCDLDVVSARATTVGSMAVDAFYVRDAAGHKVDDDRVMGRITAALREAIAGDGHGTAEHEGGDETAPRS